MPTVKQGIPLKSKGKLSYHLRLWIEICVKDMDLVWGMSLCMEKMALCMELVEGSCLPI